MEDLTLGSLFSGIGGFDYGFEKAGFRTQWQVENNPTHRIVLAERFPHATRFNDVREVGKSNLEPVTVIMLYISESPRHVVESSLSAVLDDIPHETSWMTPHNWKLYLLRLLRSKSHASRAHRLSILLRLNSTGYKSVWVVRFSSLKRTDGVRWLSGKEALRLMGFPADWITKICTSITQREMPSSLPWQNGLPKKYSSRTKNN